MKIDRIIMVFFIVFGFLKAVDDNYLNIDATFFEADEKQGLLYFKDNVVITKNKDILKAQRVVVNMTASKKNSKKKIPKDFTATGNVSFSIYTKGSILKGKGDSVFYNPNEKRYIIMGNGYLEEVNSGKKLTANKIYIDQKTGKTKIDGDKNKPVKFRFRLDEMENKK